MNAIDIFFIIFGILIAITICVNAIKFIFQPGPGNPAFRSHAQIQSERLERGDFFY